MADGAAVRCARSARAAPPGHVGANAARAGAGRRQHPPRARLPPSRTAASAGALGPQYGVYRAPGYMQQKIDAASTRGVQSMVVV